jgi:hypothetical protein
MYYLIFYDKKTHQILSLQARTSSPFDPSRYPKRENEEIWTGELDEIPSVPGDYLIKIEDKGVSFEYSPRPVLTLKPEKAELKADGVSKLRFEVQTKKRREDGELIDYAGSGEIRISASRGLLSALKAELVNGRASFTLTSVPETVTSTVMVSGRGFYSAHSEVQFVPP